MGYYADKSTARGQLYLITRDEEPFCGMWKIFNSYKTLGSFLFVETYTNIVKIILMTVTFP